MIGRRSGLNLSKLTTKEEKKSKNGGGRPKKVRDQAGEDTPRVDAR